VSEARDAVEKTVGAGRRYSKGSEETGGDRTLIGIEVAPGGGNAPHYHKTYAEHFELLDGCLEVLGGGQSCLPGPGERTVAEKNVLHRFRNPTDVPTRFLVELRPGRISRRRSRPGTGWRSTA
jgi:mannose-6-phosphate isomerase-like protein (cupin superfamily)